MKKIIIRDVDHHDLTEKFYDAILVKVTDVYKNDRATESHIAAVHDPINFASECIMQCTKPVIKNTNNEYWHWDKYTPPYRWANDMITKLLNGEGAIYIQHPIPSKLLYSEMELIEGEN